MRICNPQPFVSVPLFERIANPLSLAHRIAFKERMWYYMFLIFLT